MIIISYSDMCLLIKEKRKYIFILTIFTITFLYELFGVNT